MNVRVDDLDDRELDRREPGGRRRLSLIHGKRERPGGTETVWEPPAASLWQPTGPAFPSTREPGRESRLHEMALRLFNFTVAAVGLVLTSPLFLLIAAAIKLDSDGPVFYRQLRVGVDRRRGDDDPSPADARRTGDLGGKPFALYKFRTMEVDAEHESGPSWSGQEDDRVTRVGRFLRGHRLDELPQLWNVLKGEMAIVGPRPERPLFFQRLRQVFDAYPERQTVPPGITGWAQVNRDSDTCLSDVEHKLRYDLEYLHRRSLWFDVYIMLKTPVVMAGWGSVDGAGPAEEPEGGARKEER